MIYKYDVSIAKNYLNEEELKKLNNLTNFFLDYAESMAEEDQVMTMKDWINETDNLLKFRKKEILKDSGKVSHKQAIEIVEKCFIIKNVVIKCRKEKLKKRCKL